MRENAQKAGSSDFSPKSDHYQEAKNKPYLWKSSKRVRDITQSRRELPSPDNVLDLLDEVINIVLANL